MFPTLPFPQPQSKLQNKYPGSDCLAPVTKPSRLLVNTPCLLCTKSLKYGVQYPAFQTSPNTPNSRPAHFLLSLHPHKKIIFSPANCARISRLGAVHFDFVFLANIVLRKEFGSVLSTVTLQLDNFTHLLVL